MRELYTSQVHLKRLLAGQATPAFTPSPQSVLKVLDPEFFPGMGALNEDIQGRVQCPVRGCGEWHQLLARHLNISHKGIGGASAVKTALDLPLSSGLASARVRAAYRSRNNLAGKGRRNPKGTGPSNQAHARRSMASRNFADSCPAQLETKISALAKKIGHSPSASDFRNEYGTGVFRSVLTVFGSWNAAKATCGLSTNKSNQDARVTAALCAESLREWHRKHGDLPTVHEVRNPTIGPRLPTYKTILKAFGVDSWDAAMHSAIAFLRVKSERYGRALRRKIA